MSGEAWTVDMDERKRLATEEARPFKDQATAKNQTAGQWSQRAANLKKADPRVDLAVEEATAKVRDLTREARELAAKAKEIEDAIYDLKAVNPHKPPVVDIRTPDELISIIERFGPRRHAGRYA